MERRHEQAAGTPAPILQLLVLMALILTGAVRVIVVSLLYLLWLMRMLNVAQPFHLQRGVDLGQQLGVGVLRDHAIVAQRHEQRALRPQPFAPRIVQLFRAQCWMLAQ